MRNPLGNMAERLGLRRAGAAAPPLDQRPVGSMALWGIGLGLILGLPLALVLHHPWGLLIWSAVIGGLLIWGGIRSPCRRIRVCPSVLQNPNPGNPNPWWS